MCTSELPADEVPTAKLLELLVGVSDVGFMIGGELCASARLELVRLFRDEVTLFDRVGKVEPVPNDCTVNIEAVLNGERFVIVLVIGIPEESEFIPIEPEIVLCAVAIRAEDPVELISVWEDGWPAIDPIELATVEPGLDATKVGLLATELSSVVDAGELAPVGAVVICEPALLPLIVKLDPLEVPVGE